MTPLLPPGLLRRSCNFAAFDVGRGCPFRCSFCTIINVQGRNSRYRSADDIEQLIRAHAVQGVKSFFITDDNFARNKNWESILDRIIEEIHEQLPTPLHELNRTQVLLPEAFDYASQIDDQVGQMDAGSAARRAG